MPVIESSGAATDIVEESIGNDFVEESIEDEKQVVQASGKSQTFSVHDAEEEEKDQVMDMKTMPRSPPGNSTVNMASVVPNARIIEPTELG